MITFLLVIHALIAAALVGIILMQKSEGGGLGMGGGPAGLMSARGAADFLTRATAVLATLFVVMAFVIAAIASRRDSGGKIDASLATQAPVAPITAPASTGSPLPGIPMAGAPSGPPIDPATAQALQPATAGLPGVPAPAPTADQLKAQAAAERANAAALRKANPAPEIKKIDTNKADKAVTINNDFSIARKPATSTAPAPTPATAAPKPAVPTLNIPAPTVPAANGATPQ
jgi:preprotein translocase subunit SecG